jgi:hypothetical protein
MADREFREALTNFPVGADTREPWDFLAIENTVNQSGPEDELKYQRLMRLLSVAPNQGFKLWRLSPARALLGLLFSAGTIGAVLAVFSFLVGETVHRVIRTILGTNWSGFASKSWFAAAAACSLVLLIKLVHRLVGSRKSLSVIVTGLLMSTIGWIPFVLHLLFFDPQYLSYGSVRKLGSKKISRR